MTEPYYQDESVSLYLGDFRDHLDVLHGLTVDAIVTDPPYGETSLEWDQWPTGWLSVAAGISSNMWCFGSWRMFQNNAAEFEQWTYAEEVVWEKQNGSSLANDRWRRVHEFATHWYRGRWGELYNRPPRTPDAVKKTVRRKAKPTQHQGNAGASRYTSIDGGDRLMRSVVRLRNMHGRAINETEKPVPLVRLFVEASTPPGGLVVDLFAGSCSTGIAARQLGRRAVLFEKRESQCELAAIRLESQTEQPLDLWGGDLS